MFFPLVSKSTNILIYNSWYLRIVVFYFFNSFDSLTISIIFSRKRGHLDVLITQIIQYIKKKHIILNLFVSHNTSHVDRQMFVYYNIKIK